MSTVAVAKRLRLGHTEMQELAKKTRSNTEDALLALQNELRSLSGKINPSEHQVQTDEIDYVRMYSLHVEMVDSDSESEE